jgi:hypothetical protein
MGQWAKEEVMKYFAYRMPTEIYMFRKADGVIEENHMESKEFNTPEERDAFVLQEWMESRGGRK